MCGIMSLSNNTLKMGRRFPNRQLFASLDPKSHPASGHGRERPPPQKFGNEYCVPK
jgi:hypothetical protein